jgi:hypothetical protein
MTYYIWDHAVGVVEAAKLCKSVDKFKELKAQAKASASPEFAVYIGGKILTFAR